MQQEPRPEYSPIVEDIWRRNSPNAVGFISSLDRETGVWVDVPYQSSDPVEFYQLAPNDIFFSPLCFKKPRRLNQNMAPSSVLFADLDPVHPESLDIRPHIAWETSNRMYQAVWFLADTIPYSTKWANLNRRMTYHTGADKGGWMASKVLRIPNTINYKRGGELGHVLWDENHPEYDYDYLDTFLPQMDEHSMVPRMAPQVIRNRGALDEIWERLSPRLQYMLTKKRVNDRSKYIINVAHNMRREGVKIEDAFQMLWYAPYNKWRYRNNPDRLWTELNHVYEGAR